MSAYRFLAAAGKSPFRSQRRGLPVSSRHPAPPQGPLVQHVSLCHLPSHQRFLALAMSAYRFLASAWNLRFRSATARFARVKSASNNAPRSITLAPPSALPDSHNARVPVSGLCREFANPFGNGTVEGAAWQGWQDQGWSRRLGKACQF